MRQSAASFNDESTSDRFGMNANRPQSLSPPLSKSRQRVRDSICFSSAQWNEQLQAELLQAVL
jgi:hypothetical protein